MKGFSLRARLKVLNRQLNIKEGAEIEPHGTDESDRVAREFTSNPVLFRLRKLVVDEDDALRLAVLVKLFLEVIGEHEIELLAHLPFKSNCQINVALDNALETDDLLTRKYLVFELPDEELRVQASVVLIISAKVGVDREKFTVNLHQVHQVNGQSDVKLSL